MNIKFDSLISACCFDEYNIDVGTAGLCGTFALALKHVVDEAKSNSFVASDADVRLALLCVNDVNGNPVLCRDGTVSWRHVVVSINNELFDIEGLVYFDDISLNYCYESKNRSHMASLVFLGDQNIENMLKSDDRSFDQFWYDKWVSALGNSMNSILNGDDSIKIDENSFNFSI